MGHSCTGPLPPLQFAGGHPESVGRACTTSTRPFLSVFVSPLSCFSRKSFFSLSLLAFDLRAANLSVGSFGRSTPIHGQVPLVHSMASDHRGIPEAYLVDDNVEAFLKVV